MKFVCSPFTFAQFAPVMGAVAVGSFAFFASAESARAATVEAGFDYLATPANGSTTFTFQDFMGMGNLTVDFKGLPINQAVSGLADTVVERTKDVPAVPAVGSLPVGNLINGTTPEEYVTPIVIRDLSLMSLNPVLIPGMTGSFDVFVGLDPSKTSGGEMAIANNPENDSPGGIWSSYFGINGIAVIAPTGTLNPQEPDFVKGLIEGCPNATTYQCKEFSKGFDGIRTIDPMDGVTPPILPMANTGAPFKAENEPWSHTAGPGQIEGPGSSNFYLTGRVIHDSGDGATHTVDPKVPEPSAVLASIVGLGAMLKLKRKQKSEA